jgi:hypothetical protein
MKYTGRDHVRAAFSRSFTDRVPIYPITGRINAVAAEEIIEGLEGTHRGGIRYPIPTALEEFPMPPHYFVEVQDLMVKKKPAKQGRK